MKRKRLDRDAWGFQFFPYYQMRVETEHFKGLAALICMTSGEYQYWDYPKAGKTKICGAVLGNDAGIYGAALLDE